MLLRKRIGFITASATMVLACSPGAAAAPDTGADDQIDEMRAEIAELRTQVRRLQAITNEDWLSEQRAEEIRNLVQDVLADADTRASLLQSGLAAGYNGGFFIGSTDGNFLLKINSQIQARFILNNQDNSPDDNNRWGFEIRRAKLKFKGHAVDPSWKYAINAAFEDSRSGDLDGHLYLEDAFITKDFDNGWSVRVGQFKPPFMREELVSSSKQMAVERSLMNEEFNQDRAQGVEMAYHTDQFAVKAMFHDGFDTENTVALDEDTEFAITARVEALLAGNSKQFKDFASWEGEDFGLVLGGAAHYEKEESGTAAGPEEETFTWTVDASAEFGGANVFAAIVGRHLDVADTDQFGIVLQGAMFVVPDEWEAFARYEWGDFDTAGVEDLSVLTLGVNRYWAKHTLKWTTDIGFAFDEISSVWATGSAGWRTDTAGEDGQVVVRSQFQLLF